VQSQFPAIAQAIGRRSPGQQPCSAQQQQLLALTASAALLSVVEAADSGSEVGRRGECALRHDQAKTRNNKAKARSGQLPIALPKQRPAGL
jgi:hypothetical protein